MDGGLFKFIGFLRVVYGEILLDGKYVVYVFIIFWDFEWCNYRGGQVMFIWIVDMVIKEL